MERKLRNYGFKVPKIEEEHYKFGSALPIDENSVLREDGQWDNFLPKYEPQTEPFGESFGCTIWGGQNQRECYFKAKFGIEPNYTERFNYILAGVDVGGQDPQVSYESFRKNGMIETPMSVPDTFMEWKNPKAITPELIAEGKKDTQSYGYFHEWVRPTNPAKIKELIVLALRFSPIAVSVTAWFEENGLYVDNGLPNSHWCVCYGYIKDETGLKLKIFDSYDHSTKLLHPDHNVQFAKRIYIEEIPETEVEPPKSSWWFVDIFRQLWYAIRDLFYFNLEK